MDNRATTLSAEQTSTESYQGTHAAPDNTNTISSERLTPLDAVAIGGVSVLFGAVVIGLAAIISRTLATGQ